MSVKEITKEYPGVKALDAISLDFKLGQVTGIVGENGAGKSTLMKILSGVEQPSSGELMIEGKPSSLSGVKIAEDLGIVMIHQELSLAEDMSIHENVFLGREKTKFGFVLVEEQVEATQKLLEKVQCKYKPTEIVGNLPLAQKQLVEIARAIGRGARLVIMDEPTAVLSKTEIDALFLVIADLKQEGVAVLFISHALEEVIEVSDEITVLRDGKHVVTEKAGECSQDFLAKNMVGREMTEYFPPKNTDIRDDILMRVKNLSSPGYVKEFSLEVRLGEIVGVAGLVGSGRTEACEALVGLREGSSDGVYVSGRTAKIQNYASALDLGIAYLSEDRKLLGLHLSESIEWNTTLAHLSSYTKAFIEKEKISEAAKDWIKKLRIKTESAQTEVLNLSGGNQQKVCLAKWLDLNPKVLILDEPTRGVDVGAKSEIYGHIQSLAKEGMGFIVVSSELPELLGLCHRILVMRKGEVVGEFHEKTASEESIMDLAIGVKEQVN